MQQVRWFSIVGLIILALILVACGDNNEDSEANTQSNDEIPANVSDTANNDAVSIPENSDTVLDFGLGNEIVVVEPQSVQAGDGTILINITMPDGYKFNDLAPFRGDFESDGISVAMADEWLHYEQLMPTMPLEIPVRFTEGQATITADLHIYWCEAINETLCFVDNQVLTILIIVDGNADATVADALIALVPPE